MVERDDDFEERLVPAVTGLRHAQSLAAATAADSDLARSSTASQAIARFVIDAYAIGRQAADPDVAIEETFDMIDAAWQVTAPTQK